jgi:hypothetical protein
MRRIDMPVTIDGGGFFWMFGFRVVMQAASPAGW